MGTKASTIYKENEFGENTVTRTKRYIPDSDLREYADSNNITMEKLKDGLSRIIEDNGKENTKVAKEVEQILDKKLQDGYTSLREGKIPPNQDYIDLVSGKVKPNELLNADMESNADEGIVANEEGKVKGENERPYVLKEVPEKQKTPLKERIVEAIDKTYRSVVDKGQTIYKIAKETGNSTLYHKYDRLGTTPSEAQSQIGFAQTDLNGKKYNNFIDKNGKNVSMSVDSIWKDANNVGISDNVLGEYLVNQLNIDRINQGVEQFANLTEGESLDTIRQLEEEYPEIKRVAQNVWTYQQNQLQKMVDAGLISEDVANSFKEQTPHYVRIQRDVGNLKNNNGLKFKNGKVEVNNQIQDIKGGNLDILPLKETMAQYTQDVTQAIRKNIFGQELLNSMSVNSTDSNASIFDANDDSFGINPDILSNDGKGNYSLTIFKDGMATVVPIDSGIYESLNTNKSAFEKNIDMLGTPLRKLSGLQRTLLTDKNPIFMATNMLKDIGDAPLNSKYGMGKFYKTYAELFGNRTVGNATGKNKFKSYVELYESLGGSQNSYFSDGNFNKESKNIAKKGLSKGIELIEKGNEFIESMPRITEFVNTIKENGYTVDSDGGLIPTKGKKQTKSVDQVLNEAMYNAAEITTNFKRGGDIAKTLNRNGATFLNASIQGFDKQIRNFTERVNNPKQMVGLLAKVAALGVAPALLNNAMYDDDDEYNELQDYIKDEYYLLKDKDGKFIRIPKGRVMSIFGGAARRTYKSFNGDKDAFKGFGKEVADQVAPNSPIDNNIIAPFYAVKNNKSWSGNQIESDYLQSLPEGERADAKTTSLAKKLGELTGYSPKKIDYLIDQYTGGIGDVVQPMMTNYAEDEKDSGMSALTNPFKSKFTTESTNNQKTVSNYYELKKKIEQNSNSSKATDLDKIKYMYINKYSDVQSELSGLYAKQRDVQNSTELSNSEKYKQNKEVQKEINAKIKKTTEALNNAQKISKNVYKIGNEYYYDTIDDNGNQKWKKASAKEEKTRGYSGMSVSDYYREVKQKKIDSQTKSNEITNKLNDFLTSNKIDNDKYEEWSYHLGKLESDKDSNGKTINGSLKKKRIEYINSLPISNEQKQALYNYKYNKK